MLDRVAEPVQRPDARVAAPRKDQLARTAHADHLIVDHVRRHADQSQIALLLTDHFVTGGEGDQVCEPFERDGVAVVDKRGNGFVQ